MPRPASSRAATAIINAVQVYPFTGARSIRSMPPPARSPTSRLQHGEQLVGSGPVAAGDTVRWIIGDTESGAGDDQAGPYPGQADPARPHDQSRHQHRPPHLSSRAALDREDLYGLGRPGTIRRTSSSRCVARTPRRRRRNPSPPASISALNFRYAIEGDKPPWRPLRAFDDGRQVYIEFPRGIGQGEMPPLFIVGPDGKPRVRQLPRPAELSLIVDRLFAAAELRLGDGTTSRARAHRPHRREAAS